MGRNFWHRIATAAVASALPGYALLDVVAQAAPRQPATAQAPAPVATGSMQLQVRRLGNSVELVVEGAGPGPQLQQSSRGSGWQGQLLTATPTGLRFGPQRISLPELGIQSVSLDGSGSNYSLSVTPMPGVPLARPVVSADGLNLILAFPTAPQASLQTNRLDLSQPGAVPLPTYAPPLQARAVAPPLGDMAVGTMTVQNRGYLNLSGPPVTLTTSGANPRDLLMVMARIGGYGFAYSDLQPPRLKQGTELQPERKEGRQEPSGNKVSLPAVSVAFQNESFSRAFNFVLASSGLQARLDGRTILVGAAVLQQMLGPQVSKVYRLNQASADSAADYLANLGALVTKTFQETITATEGVPLSGAGTVNPQTTRTSTETKVLQYGGERGPLLGLQATTDTRLGTITVVGESSLVAIAQQYLSRLDLRQRQVALSVKILDVTLGNDTTIDNSFAFRFGSNYIVNDSGRLVAAFNQSLPTGSVPPSLAAIGSSDQQFFDFLEAQIVSRNTKILASPTLMLQEGGNQADAKDVDNPLRNRVSQDGRVGRSRSNEAFVQVGSSLVTSYSVKQDVNGNNFCEPQFGNSGLTLGARVDKIDDNGFVTFSLSPEISAPTGSQSAGNCGLINIINSRLLDTGQVRVRDGQTLILTGVLSDLNTQVATKWPLLGDLPLIGQFFRSSAGQRTKNELVIMVSPRIINDEVGGSYGYGYKPGSADAREFMGSSQP